MKFELDRSIEILERTPEVLEKMLAGLSDAWIYSHEGPESWGPYDVIGHLIHGEKTDWIPRMEIILAASGDNKKFQPFDRFAQFENSKGKTLSELLIEFKSLRSENLKKLRAKKLGDNDLTKTGIHPAFGKVTLHQLLSTWTVHDLTHIVQISRVMAKQYEADVGPWKEYLGILR